MKHDPADGLLFTAEQVLMMADDHYMGKDVTALASAQWYFVETGQISSRTMEDLHLEPVVMYRKRN